jgi:hypothetical protein
MEPKKQKPEEEEAVELEFDMDDDLRDTGAIFQEDDQIDTSTGSQYTQKPQETDDRGPGDAGQSRDTVAAKEERPSQAKGAPRETEGISREMFWVLANVGNGAYGQVELVKKKNTGVYYALKVLEKDHILKYDKIESVFRERDIGQDLSGHPNIVEFQATFQDADNLYFLLEYCENGSLSGLLKHAK